VVASSPTPAAEAPPATQPAWSSAPAGATSLVFREVMLGALPAKARRTTWTLIRAGSAVLLRVEDQSARGMRHLDRTSLPPEIWSTPERTEYRGTASAAAGRTTLTLQRSFGAGDPAALVLRCAPRTIEVHPALVTLVEGWKHDDDTMEPATWAPTRSERVPVLSCKEDGPPRSFDDGLSFVAGRGATTRDPASVGVEWAFVNSDMVIQQGGYRWIPAFSHAAR